MAPSMLISPVAGAHLEVRSLTCLMLDTLGMGMANLRRRLTPILPAKLVPAALETAGIHGILGRSGEPTALVTTRPCRAPHHTISDVGRIGGGHVPLSGEVSLAHHGVRCLDALPECRRQVLEVWRPPLENGFTKIQSPAHP
jgi:magnesium chelatase family protein